jgi:putative MATE family efflux protein
MSGVTLWRSRERLLAKWREIIDLGWPITVQTAVRTGMRTTDLLVTGTFGPAAIAALGLANLYARVALFTGIGIGTGALSLGSQDTGSGADANKNEAISQALGLGFLVGIPLALFAFFFTRPALSIFGAPADVIALGAPYLAIVLGTAPARHVTLVGEKALQGTGDTMTPMYIRGGSNVANILGTVGLGLGVGPLPRLEVVGVALSTAGANVLAGLAVVGFMLSSRTDVTLVRPRDPVITKQIVTVGAPRTVQGLSRTAASFPLSAILVGFSVEIYAAYQVGRRVAQQLTGPLARSLNVVSSIQIGQAIGAQEIDEVRFNTAALASFGLLTTAVLSAGVFVWSESLAAFFGDDQATLAAATVFIQVFAVAAVLRTLARIYAGALQGGSDTIKPFLAELFGGTGLLLAVTYVGGVLLGYGVLAAYAGIVLSGAVRLLMVFGWYRGTGWLDAALDGMENRGSIGND